MNGTYKFEQDFEVWDLGADNAADGDDNGSNHDTLVSGKVVGTVFDANGRTSVSQQVDIICLPVNLGCSVRQSNKERKIQATTVVPGATVNFHNKLSIACAPASPTPAPTASVSGEPHFKVRKGELD